jgi:acetylglutamate kinase
MTSGEAGEMIASGVAAGGMIPKIRCCQDALAKGVGKAHIVDGRLMHAILLEMFTRQGIGTEIVR